MRTATVVQGWPELQRELAIALGKVENVGVRWRGSRFDQYRRVVEELASMDRVAIPRRPGNRLTYEALSQCSQLLSASRLFDCVPRDLLVPKLETIFEGPDLFDGDERREDAPRNVLFELTVAHLLRSFGFHVQLTRHREDIVASHSRISRPLSVECKRPAPCTDDNRENRVKRNLVKLRNQLAKRDPRNVRVGVLAMDGVYGLGDRVLRADDANSLRRMVMTALSSGVSDIRRLARDKALHLESGMRVAGLALVASGVDAQGTAYGIQSLRLFLLGDDRELGARFREIFSPDDEPG